MEKKPKCYNCVFASKGFKISEISKLTYHTCHEPEMENRIKNGEHPFEALVVFSDTCDKHQFKIKH